MRKAGATGVDVGDISVRFEPKCEREHATDDEPSEEEWQRRHEWFDKYGDHSVADLDDDDDDDELPPVPFGWSKPADEPVPPKRDDHLSDDSKFDDWYTGDTTPPDSRR